MNKLGQHRSAWKIQRALLTELPGLGKPGALERREYPPGQHGMARRKFSEYSLRLKEKQKLVFNYVLREEQLRRLVKKAKSGRDSDWMATLVGLLESRLDTLVFRLGFAPSMLAARQMVSHGKVFVNGKKVTIGSFMAKAGDEISLSDAAYKSTIFNYSIQQPRLLLADWLEHTKSGDKTIGKLKFTPPKDAVPFAFEGRLVAEYYTGI
jgi:small subunit ribosomal protein S4